jgi:hypothetical protein
LETPDREDDTSMLYRAVSASMGAENLVACRITAV